MKLNNTGNIMYVGLTSMQFRISHATYESIEEFNKVMLGMAEGLYKLGDYKKLERYNPETEPA